MARIEARMTAVPTTPTRLGEEEQAKSKAWQRTQMKNQLKEMQDELASLFDEEGNLHMPNNENKVKEMNEMILELHKSLYPTDKKEEGQEEQGTARNMSMQSTDEEGQWVDYWEAPKPRHSSTEICIGDLNESAQIPDIAAILGGGNIIRDVRRADNHTYVAFWTVHGAMDGLEYARQKLERAGHTCSYVQRARWRDDLHSHEISSGQDAQAVEPHYTPFDITPMYQDWGSTTTRRRITQSATSEGSSACFTASVQMKPLKKRTRRSPRASGDVSESS